MVQNIHYAALSDLTWFEGKVLAISSLDGYITFCSFQNEGSLGTPLEISGKLLYFWLDVDASYPESIKDQKTKNFEDWSKFKDQHGLGAKGLKVEQTSQVNYVRSDGKKVIVPKKTTYIPKND